MSLFLSVVLAGWLAILVLHRIFSRRSARRAAEARDDGVFTPLTEFVQGEIKRLEISAAGLLLVRDGSVVYKRGFGSFSMNQRLPIASAAKWISTSVIMSVVDEGLLLLDEPISRLLPWMRGRKSVITLRQLLACTSGFPSRVSWLKVPGMTLEENVMRIAAEPLVAEPGTQFVYGGVGFQVAGYLAELVTGQNWERLFERRLRRPLGLAHTRFGYLDRREMRFDPDSGDNPHIGGGVETTARDYVKVVDMLAAGGRFEGKQVLSLASVTEMLTEQTRDAQVTQSGHWNRDAGYCLGGWIDRYDSDGGVAQVSCPGSLGWYPWIDLEQGYGGVFCVSDEARRLARFYPRLTAIGADIM